MVDLTIMLKVQSPFPRRVGDQIVVDEMCTCGRKRSEHVTDASGVWRHGGCEKTLCEQFTWASMVTEEVSA